MQQKKGNDGKRKEEQARIDPLPRELRNQQRQQEDRRQKEGQIDAPTLRLRIKAIDELAEFGLNERPARANRTPGIFGKTGGPIVSAPDRVDQQKLDRGHDDEPQQQRAHDRDQD